MKSLKILVVVASMVASSLALAEGGSDRLIERAMHFQASVAGQPQVHDQTTEVTQVKVKDGVAHGC